MRWWELLPPCKVTQVRFQPNVICGLSLLLILTLLRGFFSGFSGFPPSWKTNTSIFQFDQDRWPEWKPAKADVAFSLNVISCYSFIYLLLFYLWINKQFYRDFVLNYYTRKLQTFDTFYHISLGDSCTVVLEARLKIEQSGFEPLTEVIVLCSWTKQFAFILPLSSQGPVVQSVCNIIIQGIMIYPVESVIHP